MAAAIGKDADAARYAALSEDIAEAFVESYMAADGTVQGDSQTGYVLAIGMDLLPDGLRAKAAERLVANVERHDWHLATGFLGTPDLLPALSDTGHLDVAYRLLLNDTYPSWGYEIAKGATTIWERWNSIMPDGSFGDVSMNSFNHYAYGAVGDWMYRTIAGIQPDPRNPGYGHVTIAPRPGGSLTWAKASYRSVHGGIRTDWKLDERGDLRLNVTVPANTTATVRVPAPGRHAVTEGGRPAEQADGVRFVKLDDGAAVFEIGSGSYSFAVDRVLGDLGEAADAVRAAVALVDELAGDLSPSAGRAPARPARQAHHRDGEGGHVVRDGRRVCHGGGRAPGPGDRRRPRPVAAYAGQGRSGAGGDGRPVQRAARPGRPAALRGVVGADRRGREAGAAGGRAAPGRPRPRHVVITNGGANPLTGVSSTLRAGEGWTVTPVGSHGTEVAAGATVRHSYDLRVPAGQPPSTVPVTGSAGYRHQGGTATVPVAGPLTTVPAVAIASTTAEPAEVTPGDATTVRTVLRNRSTVPVTGQLTTTPPDGWTVEPAIRPYELAPGAETTVATVLTAPLSVTEGPAGVTIATGATDAERRTLTVPVRFHNPPPDVLDHVDLGNAASEQAHKLAASTHSGTNVEAGLTRRYTNVSYPGGWFEFDLAVEPGRPFILRAVETYDQAQLKDYEVVVDGAVVHSRSHRRTAGGAGTVSYQFVVDLPEATQDGTVRVQFRDTGEGYDPSIADVWSMPVPARPVAGDLP